MFLAPGRKPSGIVYIVTFPAKPLNQRLLAAAYPIQQLLFLSIEAAVYPRSFFTTSFTS